MSGPPPSQAPSSSDTTAPTPPATTPTVPPRRRRNTTWIVIGVVAVVIIAGVIAAIVLAVPNVTVSGINLDVVGLSSGPCKGDLSVPVGPYVYLRSSTNYLLASTFSSAGLMGSSCTVTSIVTNSTGWSSTPISAAVLICGQSSSVFTIQFKTPSGPYYGPLTLEANTTYVASNPGCVGISS